MGDAIGEVLPAAVGVALSPFPIIAIVLVLGSARARTNGVAFAVGWVVALGALTAVLIALTEPVEDGASDASTAAAWARIAIGAALGGVAVRKWARRPAPGEMPKTPAWMAAIDDLTPARTLGLAALLGAANPKNIAFTFAAAASISAVGLSGSDAAVAGAVYVVLASATVLGALLAHLVAGDRAAAGLAATKDLMLANEAVIMAVILAVLGAKVLGDGIAAL